MKMVLSRLIGSAMTTIGVTLFASGKAILRLGSSTQNGRRRPLMQAMNALLVLLTSSNKKSLRNSGDRSRRWTIECRREHQLL